MRYGYFDDQAKEYVIDRVDAPVSLTNYLGTQRMGAVLSHNAGGYCWLDSPQYHRITRFRPNGVPMDFPGHYVYLRDRDSGRYWSLSWQPTGLPLNEAKYLCRHGLGYSVYECAYEGIAASQTVFIPRTEEGEMPVELIEVRIRNLSGRPRQLSIFGYVEFSFHHIDMDNQNFQMSLYAAGSSMRDGAVLCELHYESAWQFFTTDGAPASFDGVREAFIGPYRTERNPLGVERGVLSGSTENGGNPCGALERRVTLASGEEKRVLFYLGTGDEQAAAQARNRYSQAGTRRAFDELKAWWESKLSALQVKTPAREYEPQPQHLEFVSKRDKRSVFTLCFLYRGGRAHGAWVPRYRAGRHVHSPRGAVHVPKAPAAAAAWPGSAGLRPASV